METARKKATKSQSLISGTKSGKVKKSSNYCHIHQNFFVSFSFPGQTNSWRYFQNSALSSRRCLGCYNTLVMQCSIVAYHSRVHCTELCDFVQVCEVLETQPQQGVWVLWWWAHHFSASLLWHAGHCQNQERGEKFVRNLHSINVYCSVLSGISLKGGVLTVEVSFLKGSTIFWVYFA